MHFFHDFCNHEHFEEENNEKQMLEVIFKIIKNDDHVEKKLKAVELDIDPEINDPNDEFFNDPSLMWFSNVN